MVTSSEIRIMVVNSNGTREFITYNSLDGGLQTSVADDRSPHIVITIVDHLTAGAEPITPPTSPLTPPCSPSTPPESPATTVNLDNGNQEVSAIFCNLTT